TDMSSSWDRIDSNTCRTTAESSTTRTLIFPLSLWTDDIFPAVPSFAVDVDGWNDAAQRWTSGGQSLSVANKQEAAGSQVLDQSIQNASPALHVEVDEHVAAENEVEFAKPGRIVPVVQIQSCKPDDPYGWCCLDLSLEFPDSLQCVL